MFENGFFQMGDLIVIGIVLVFFFLYNRIDRSSKTLEKVRKYADKVRADLDKIVSDKRTDIRDLTIDLEVEEKRNREILSRFDQARQDMLQRAQGMEEFQLKVDQYNKYMNDLQLMTSRIDENLLRLREESAYVDSLGKRMTDIKNKENSLIKGLNAIDAAFQKQNKDNLEKTKEAILSEYRGELDRLQTGFENISGGVLEFQNRMQKLLKQREELDQAGMDNYQLALEELLTEYDQRIGKAAARGMELEGEIFGKLKDDIESRAKGLEDNWMGGIMELRDQVAGQVNEIKGLIAEDDQRINAVHKRLEEVEMEAREQAAGILERQQDLYREYERESADAMDRLRSELSSVEEVKQSFEDQIADFREDMTASLQNMEETLKLQIMQDAEEKQKGYQEILDRNFNKLERMISDFESMEAEIKANLGSAAETLHDDFEAYRNGMEQEIDRLKDNAAAVTREIQDQFEGISGVKEEFLEALGHLRGEMEGDIRNEMSVVRESMNREMDELKVNAADVAQSIQDQFTSISTVKDDFVEALGALRGEMEGEIRVEMSTIREGMNQEIDQLKEKSADVSREIQDQFAGISDIKKEFVETLRSVRGELETEIRTEMSSVEQSLMGKWTEFENELKTLREDERVRAEDDLQRMNAMVQEMDRIFDDLKVRSEETLEGKFGRLEQDISDSMEQRTVHLSRLVEDWQNGFESKVDDVARQIRQERIDAEKQFTDSLDERMSLLEDAINERIGALQTRAATIQDAVLQEVEQNGREISEQTRSVQSQIESLKSDTRETLEIINQELKSVQDVRSDYQQNLDQIRSEMERKMEEMDGFLHSHVDELSGKVQHKAETMELELLQDIEKRHKSYQKSINQQYHRLEGFIGDLDGLENSLRRSLSEITGRVKEEFSIFDRNLAEQRSREIEQAESELKQVSMQIGELEDSLGEIRSGMQDKASGLEEEMRLFRDEEAEKNEMAAQRLRAAMGQLEEELRTFRDKTVDVSRQELGGMEERFLAELEERSGRLHQQISDWEQSLESRFSEIGGRYEEARKELEKKYAVALKGRLDTIRKDVFQEFGQFKDQVQEMSESLMDNIRQTEEKHNGMRDELRSTVEDLKLEAERLLGEIQQNMQDAQGLRGEFSSKLESFSSELEERIGSVEISVQQHQDESRQRVLQQIASFEENLSDSLSSRNAELTGRIDDWQNELNRQLEETRQLKNRELEKVNSQLRDEFAEQIQNTENRINEQFSVIKNLAKQYRESVMGEVETAGSQFDDYREKMVGELDALRGKTEKEVLAYRETLAETESLRNTITGSLDNYREQAAVDLDNVQDDIRQKIAEITQQLDNTTETMESVLMNRIEKRHSSYEQLITNRYDKMETFITDMDELEKSLRLSMDQEVMRVQSELEQFSDNMRQMRAEERKQLEGEAAELRRIISDMEQRIDDMKSLAMANISEKLKGFEEEFFDDLKQRNVLLQQRLDEWQDDIDKEVSEIAQKNARQRENMEKRYLDELEKRMTGLRDSVYGDMTGLAEDVKNHRGDMQTKLENDAVILKSEMMQLVDSSLKDVEVWQTRVLEQIKEQDRAVQEDIVRLKGSVDETVLSLENEIDKEKQRLVDVVQDDRMQFQQQLQAMQRQMQELQTELDEKSEEALGRFQNAFQTFVGEFKGSLAQMKEESGQKIGQLQQDITVTQNEIQALHGRLSSQIESDYSQLNESFLRIQEAQEQYLRETDLFQKTDEMREDLRGGLDRLQEQLETVRTERGELAGMHQELERVLDLYQEASQRIGRFLSEKQKVDLLENKMDQIMTLSGSVDDKFKAMAEASDTLQDYQIRLKQMEDLHLDMSNRYDRLEKKLPVLDQTTNGLDSTYQTLDTLENRLKQIAVELQPMQQELQSLEERNNNLMLESDKVDLLYSRISALDEVLTDIDAKVNNVDEAREWMARLETRLGEITKEAQEKVRLFGTVTSQQGRDAKDKGAPDMDTRDIVVKLAREGWKKEEIARSTRLGLGEVELILEMSQRRAAK